MASQAWHIQKLFVCSWSFSTYHWVRHTDDQQYLRVWRGFRICLLQTTWHSFESWELQQRPPDTSNGWCPHYAIASLSLISLCYWLKPPGVHTQLLLFAQGRPHTQRAHLLCRWLPQLQFLGHDSFWRYQLILKGRFFGLRFSF